MERACAARRAGRRGTAETESGGVTASGGGAWRVVELLAIFVLGPLTVALVIHRLPVQQALLFPSMWLLAGVSLLLLMRDRGFDRRQLWNPGAARAELGRIAVRWAVLSVIFVAGMAAWNPEMLWWLPRHRPGWWTVVMVGYPVLSVWAQELGFRVFFFHRYGCLFRSRWGLVAVNALVFGLAHLVMHNAFAVVLSTIGGLVFADTYLRTRSLAAVIVEHALYGCMLFTVGWGLYFVAGMG